MRAHESLRRRFALRIAAVAGLVIAAVAIALYLVLASFLEAGGERDLQALVERIDVELEHDEPMEIGDDFPRDVAVRLVVGGQVRAATPGFPDLSVTQEPGYRIDDDHQVLVVDGRSEGFPFVLQLASDATGVRRPLQAYLSALVWILPLATLGIALASAVTAGGLIAPLADLERAARAVGHPDDLRRPLPGTAARDELGRLARTLQRTFGRLADAAEREQAFTRAAAHDLRSPLAAVRVRVQTALARPRDADAYRDVLRELDHDVARLARLTDQLLLLARDPEGFVARPLDLTPLAAEAVERARSRHPDVILEFDAQGRVPVAGDPELLAHVLDNLLDNALRHGGGADTTVSVTTGDDGRPWLRVHDEGPGVPAEVLERLGRPFFRADAARSSGGSGLGLSIVQRLAGLHGAEVTFASTPGQGFTADVHFPPAPARS